MSDAITTSANRVKNGGYWCEDATAITQAALDKYSLTWDTEIPLKWGLEALGLANTILALGSVRPRYKSRADIITVHLMHKLYDLAVILGAKVGFTFTQTKHWLGNPDRANSCKAQRDMWLRLGHDMTKPANKAIADALAILFSADPKHISCVHASKLLLAAVLQVDGAGAAIQVRHDLITFLEGEFDNG